jgi:hypothetical protein
MSIHEHLMTFHRDHDGAFRLQTAVHKSDERDSYWNPSDCCFKAQSIEEPYAPREDSEGEILYIPHPKLASITEYVGLSRALVSTESGCMNHSESVSESPTRASDRQEKAKGGPY